MKKIQYFKLFESRTAELTEEEFLNLVKNKCKDFLKKPKYLQRIKTSYDGEYSYINPKLSYRQQLVGDRVGVFSAHHTLLMDNLPSWRDFPKRTQSIIGSTNFVKSTTFGHYYYCIIPYDNANFGVAPDSDLWSSYCEITGEFNHQGYNKYRFNDYFSESFLQTGISDNSYEEMMNDIQSVYDDYLNNVYSKFTEQYYTSNLLSKMKEDNIKDVKVAFDKYFAPNNFMSVDKRKSKGFVNMNYYEISKVNGKSKEFWTDSECLVVYLGCIKNTADNFFPYKNYEQLNNEIYSKYQELLKLIS